MNYRVEKLKYFADLERNICFGEYYKNLFLLKIIASLPLEYSKMNNIIYGLGISLFTLFLVLTPTTPLDLVAPAHNNISKSSIPSPQIFPQFIDRTLEVGLFYAHLQGDHKLTGLNEALGAGVCAFDYDNDNRIDLFMVGGSGQTRFYGKQHWWQQAKGNRLFRNVGSGKFEDVTEEAGLTQVVWGMGCSTGDLDNDGDPELMVTSTSKNYLYENLGNGQFNDISQQAGLQGDDWSTSVTMADYDNDGLLDIYISNYLRYEKGAKTFESYSGFSLGKKPAFDAALYDGIANQLWQNQGNLMFKNVANVAGVSNESGRSLSAIWMHLDEDSFPDLYVLNDAGFPNQLYKNNGDGSFTEVGESYNLNLSEPSASAALGDINNDGISELSVTSNAGQLSKLFQRNKNNAQYNDRARKLGLGIERYGNLEGWSQTLGDFNNDGWLDQLTVNGMHTPDPIALKLTQGQRTLLQINLQGKGFKTNPSNESVSLLDSHSSRGAAVADFDNDGDLDIYMASNNDLGQYLENISNTKNHWLRLHLQGTKSNRDAIGSRVWIEFDQGRPEIQKFQTGGFLSQHDNTIHVGLGNHEKPVNIEVQWPNGDKQRFNQIPIDQSITLIEGQTRIVSLMTLPLYKTTLSSFNLNSLSSSEKTTLLDLVAQLDNKPEFLELLENNLSDQDSAVRLHALKYISKDGTIDTFKLLVSALDHEDLKTQLAALEVLRLREEEHSSRWLIRQFKSSSPEIKQKIAEIYGFFFNEEEAMIHRKQLAVPYLINYLSDENDKVRTAAARALGESESFRAVDVLIEKLHNDNKAVRAEAARALGKIRERQAIEPLKNLLGNENEATIVKAHAFIALKRLGYNDFPGLFKLLLPATVNELTIKTFESNIESLYHILYDLTDGIVINPNLITTNVQRWFLNLSDSARYTLSAPTLKRSLQMLTASNNRDMVKLFESFLSHPDENVRAVCFTRLMQLNASQDDISRIKGLHDKSDLVQLAIYDTAVKLNIALPLQHVRKSLNKTTIRMAALQYVGRRRLGDIFNDVITIIQQPHIAQEHKQQAFETLFKLASLNKFLPNDIIKNADSLLRAFSITYWAKQNRRKIVKGKDAPEILIQGWNDKALEVQLAAVEALKNRREIWVLRELKRIILDKQYAFEIRKTSLKIYSQQNIKTAQRLAKKIISDIGDPLRVEAVKYVNFQNKESVNQLWLMLSDPRSTAKLQLAVALHLKNIDRQKVLSTLKKMIH